VNWRERALCRGDDPDMFFPIGNTTRGPGLKQTDAAKAVCGRCPVVRQCLDWAMEAPVEGIWGGTTESERRAARRRLVRESLTNTAHA